MHVGLIVPSFSDDEGWRIPALLALATALAPHARLSVFPLRHPDAPERATIRGATVIHLGGHDGRLRALAPGLLAAIRAEHRRAPLDLLHGYWLFAPGLLAVAAGELLGVPTVTSIGGAEVAALPGIGYGGMLSRRARLAHRAVMARATLITGGSEYVLDLARAAGAPARRLRHAPLPVALPATPAAPAGGTGAPLLLQVGAYLPVKGQDVAVRALARIRADYPDARLAIIGENPRGYRERIADLARTLGIAGAVELRERIPHAELRGWYSSADLLLMPSRHESQGMVVLEAAACGLPALGSNVGVVRDLAPDAAAAVPPGDPAALASAALELLGDSGRRQALGRAARARVASDYAVEPAGRLWLEVYRQALNGGAR